MGIVSRRIQFISFMGCFYHGCPICYDPDSVHPLKGISMATVKEKTDMTSTVLRSEGFQVVELWEHEFAEQKTNQ
ncbi:hypothetical protein CEXT_757411 [Caerostris extrusa]|uniref:Uncharacterized protein n=1 Tax=Caerostris extrusa TaxID=172846 RepID=A0AAV4Q3K9_CAEEX|nr:hypothetical protein CEXT_757411 [Caerostris extrusa]